MKKAQRFIALLTVVFMIISKITVFSLADDSQQVDIWSMTPQERTDWIIENVEPTYVGTLKPGVERSGWRYTEQHITYYRPYSNAGRMTTQLKFLYNSTNETLTDWGTVKYTVEDDVGGLITLDGYTVYKINDGNWKITYDAEIVMDLGACFVSHIYNVYGTGEYAFWDASSIDYCR
ncbi:MAG: hypothetical protein ACI3XT_07300 [Butyricicoccaceae bacterium]